MKTVLHKAESRGHANHGWLDTYHTFSFASYYNPERMNFGVLRVLNDDKIAPGTGFGKHPHENMEIISIPLSGDLEHEDSIGNHGVIKEGDIQVMSAGRGVTHSEMNHNKDQEAQFLQIWMFPNKKDVTPRYDQMEIKTESNKNEWIQILSPDPDDKGVWVHQNAWFYLCEFDADQKLTYKLHDENNGLYFFMLEGNANVNNQQLGRRDGFGLWDFSEVNFETVEPGKVLVMEVPMHN